MILGHVALSLPYVVIVVSARLKSFDSALEDAAKSLGASYWQTTFWVTVPWLMPGIIAAALFAFAVLAMPRSGHALPRPDGPPSITIDRGSPLSFDDFD